MCKLGVSEATFYRWQKQFSGMGVVEIRRLKQLEEENARLKRLVAHLSLGQDDAAGRSQPRVLRPGVRRDVVGHLQQAYWVSERRACSTTNFERSSHHYRSVRDPQPALRPRLKDLAVLRVRYGYRRLHVFLRREGWAVNHKRVYRLYREEGLAIRTKLPRRERTWRYRAGRPEIAAPNEVWAMDFMSDALFDGRAFRLLTIVDCCSREGLATVPRADFRAFDVVQELDLLVAARGKPKSIRVDNGPEFAGKLLDQWA